ncbi:MAG TPA: type 2 isopentenyl-diphosphate Delta-isomerase [Balneolaceae bacterium]|nr:type 2 isopentenyl-diphosphate Delta-isomerase [Balneolaceae bacterium]
MSNIKQRKKDHVDLTVGGDMNYKRDTGFAHYDFVHNALPEVDIDKVSTEASFLGRTYSFPLFISSMTGGYIDGTAVNAVLAEFCEAYNLPFGVGSQRVMLEDESTIESFSIVREKAPTAFIASNIGGAQLIDGLSKENRELLVQSIRADAIIVHLNPLQELMQPEGDRNFKGIEDGIRQLKEESNLPIFVKETGAGISGAVAERLLQNNVDVIDIAGAGGTSWSKVENRRPSNQNPDTMFDEWGIPTAEALEQVVQLKNEYEFSVIASGGIRSSFDIAKAFCLGADFCAAAGPIIKAVDQGGYEGLESLVQRWKRQLKIIMTLLGCNCLDDLIPGHVRMKSKRS